MKIYRSVLLLLVIIWMITVFIFSHQPAEVSSNTSGNTIRFIIEYIPILKEFNNIQKEELIEILQPIARKLAHLSIYILGGLLLFTYTNSYNITETKKIAISTLIGIIYAITDEIHQLFIPRKSRANTRCYYLFISNYVRNSSNILYNKDNREH